ncbi:hypothetical protein [Acetobacterium wieringae]|uniref:hypothetical protein n=1 Tax=Acetobacterium wieringae TaxID=52694 RepID=UPI003158728D
MIQTYVGFIVEIFKKYGMETLISFVLAIVTITVIPITWIDSLPFEKQNIYWALLFAVVFGLIILEALRKVICAFVSKSSMLSIEEIKSILK